MEGDGRGDVWQNTPSVNLCNRIYGAWMPPHAYMQHATYLEPVAELPPLGHILPCGVVGGGGQLYIPTETTTANDNFKTGGTHRGRDPCVR